MLTRTSPLSPPPAQLELFEQDLSLPDSSKMVFRVDEVANMLCICANQVRALAECGELEGVPISQAVDPQPIRKHVRITRRSIEAFLNRRRRML